MGRTGAWGHRGGEAVAVLVNGAGGRELEIVDDVLRHSLNTPTLFIRRADLHSTRMTVEVDAAGGMLEVAGRRVRPAVSWVRHASASTLAAHARPAGSVRTLEAESWSCLWGQVSAAADSALPGTAPSGPGQLADAGRLGVRVPRTVVTNDVRSGVRSIGSRRAIVKTQDFRLFETDRRRWAACLPSIVDRDDADALDAWDSADASSAGRPVILQEHVAHERELRVYYLNGAICAFDVRKPGPSSIWTDPDRVTVTVAECPPEAEKTVRTLCAAWDLHYGAFDLLVTPTGEIVFLEANPDGDWLWFERKAGWHGVSFLAAVMVRELFLCGAS